ncbi:MAG TPA: glycoside hydrolase family 16 protein [Acidobacteriaceae bacterium]
MSSNLQIMPALFQDRASVIRCFACALAVALLLPALPLAAQKSDVKQLLNPAADFAAQGGTTTSAAVTVTNVRQSGSPALQVTIPPATTGYPGIDIAAPGGKFDLSAYGHVDIRIFNPGEKPFRVNLRLDNDGNWQANPWNAELATLPPGKSTTLTVYFGTSYGHPGYALNSAAISHIKLFAGKSDNPQVFQIQSLTAAGHPGDAPPIDPATIRTKPTNGILFGKDAAFDPAKQLTTTGGAKASFTPDGIAATFSGGSGKSVLLKPAIGRWDLRDYVEVHFRLKNTGKAPITPNALINSNDGPTDTMRFATPLQPGEERVLNVSFLASRPWVAMPANSEKSALYHGRPGTGTPFISDAVSAIAISAESPSGPASLLIESITAAAPPATLPVWLGKRPPVPGDWVATFDEEFNGTTLDDKKWNIYGDNYYDQRTHWTKDDVIIGNGAATLRYEKKTGFHNDDPQQKKTEYAAGFLDSFGKFTQRYGYFEARMKLPSAPGLWPAFWMMPDRGPAAGDKYKRGDTRNGGMELDIMEFLSRWGIYRYNIALHWDGYKADHRSTGSTKIYVQPDKDGYITSGVLWQPGLLVFYCNGREVLRFEDERVPSVPEYLMFTYPSGGWDNDALDDHKLPADFVIDYVRVWQRKDLTSPPPAH